MDVQLQSQALYALFTAALSVGITYGVMLERIRALEQKVSDSKLLGERIAVLEGKIDILINQLKNDRL
jgi:hypothetical protein